MTPIVFDIRFFKRTLAACHVPRSGSRLVSRMPARTIAAGISAVRKIFALGMNDTQIKAALIAGYCDFVHCDTEVHFDVLLRKDVIDGISQVLNEGNGVAYAPHLEYHTALCDKIGTEYKKIDVDLE